MTWTNENVTSLVAWATAVAFAAFSGSAYMNKAFRIYHESMRLEHQFLTLPAVAYSVAWPIIIVFDVSALVLFFNYNYETCAQTYYIVASAFALSTLAGFVMWAPSFIKWGSARGGFLCIAWSFACASVVFGMMVAAITSSTCPVVSSTYPTGAIAAALWGVQLIWFAIQLYTSWRWMYLPRPHRNYRMWLWRHKKLVAMQIRAYMNKKYGWNAENGYGMHPIDDSGSWEADERVDSGDSWSDLVRTPVNTMPLLRKQVIKNE